MRFSDIGLSEQTLRAVTSAGYEVATPIQAQSIPPILGGQDLMGVAQTGTGKTAAFALPTIDRIASSQKPPRPRKKPPQGKYGRGRAPMTPDRDIRSLILAPTRELAAQILASLAKYGQSTSLRHAAIFGGVSQNPQVRKLQAGIDILVATPGRLLDLYNQKHVDLSQVEILILDEADQMLDMGFLPDLKKIVAAVPRERQTLMFSATMPKEIQRLAEQWLTDPVDIRVAPASTPIESVTQSVWKVNQQYKPQLLTHYLVEYPRERTIVFTRTKHGADKVVTRLTKAGIKASAIHGNKSQNARTRAIESFKSNNPPVLIATDIAARGLDISGVSHVINYDLPEVAETYVHRIGRTGRAGKSGIATSFCAPGERNLLKQIERLTRVSITVESDHPEYSKPVKLAGDTEAAAPRGHRSSQGGRGRSDGSSNRSEGGGGGGRDYRSKSGTGRRYDGTKPARGSTAKRSTYKKDASSGNLDTEPKPYEGRKKSYEGAKKPYEGSKKTYEPVVKKPYEGHKKPYEGSQKPYEGSKKPYEGSNKSYEGSNKSYGNKSASAKSSGSKYRDNNSSSEGSERRSKPSGKKPAYQGGGKFSGNGPKKFAGKPYAKKVKPAGRKTTADGEESTSVKKKKGRPGRRERQAIKDAKSGTVAAE